MPADAGTVLELGRTRCDLYLRMLINFSDAVQAIADDLDLCGKLRRIIHLLKIAAATRAEIWARWRCARRAAIQDLDDLGETSAFFYVGESDLKKVARCSEGDEDRQVFGKAEAETAWNDFLNLDLELIANVVISRH